MTKKVILTGIRANDDLHIGNYFGALLPMVDMAKTRSEEFQINLFVPDLHSITTPIDYTKLQRQILNNLKIYVAAGLPIDNDNVHIYRQSHIPAHSEVTWILDCFTGFGEMSRMTQLKDRTDKLGSDRVSVGIFNYPVLMAGDILLYGASYVPVGDDQTQHLEFTRDVAERINKRFGEILVVPESVAKQHEFFDKDQGLRIRDLANPSKKMSKSDDSDKGVIFLVDEPERAVSKIMSAATDSFSDGIKLDFTNRTGVTNLVQIYDLLNPNGHDEIMTCKNYSELKTKVAESVKNFLTEFQANLAKVDEQAILQKLEADEAKMNEVANSTLLKVQKAVGLR